MKEPDIVTIIVGYALSLQFDFIVGIYGLEFFANDDIEGLHDFSDEFFAYLIFKFLERIAQS
jgi:hypothetical protein